MKLSLLLISVIVSGFFNCEAQTAREISRAKAVFEGAWLDKKNDRHLTISIEDAGYVTINDWTGRKQTASIDAYKAYIKNGKLVMPAETEHHAPYSEIQIKGKTLIYITQTVGLKEEKLVEKIYFIKSKW